MRTLLFTSLLIFIGLILYSCSEDDKSVTPQQNPDPTIPIVNILSPIESDELIDSVNVIISATDDKGIIKVEFIVNNQVVKSWIHPPYSFKWDLTSNNDSTEISFFAKAYDADENISTTKVYHMTAWRLKSPTILTMEPVSSSSVKLIWNDNSTIETGYIIEQQVNSGIFSPIANTVANETSYVAINLDILNEYSFRVNAVRNNYSSDYTPEVSIRFDYELTSLRILTGHSYYIWSIVFSPDDNYIVSASADQTVKLWETSTGSLIRTLSGYIGDVWTVAFSPDGNYIASGSYDKTVKLWETSTGSLIRTLSGHSSSVYSVAFSPDGNYIVSGSTDQTIKLWETSTGSLIRTFSGHADGVLSISISPAGNYIVSGSQDNTVKLWETATGSLIRTFSGHINEVWSVSFSPDGNYICSGSDDQTVKLWETATGSLIRTLSGHMNKVRSVAFSPDGNYIASGSYDQTVKLWETSTGNIIHSKLISSPVTTITYSSDGNYIASNSGNNRKDITLWQLYKNWILIL
ncbi:MAG: hypothetical protein IT276_10645 [Ignavibacteriaceae bacterium]|nr:hypothetical protein [Ignavibacteriaceae bacterium]